LPDPPPPPLFPYTTLFRSLGPDDDGGRLLSHRDARALAPRPGARLPEPHEPDARRRRHRARVGDPPEGGRARAGLRDRTPAPRRDRKSTRLNSSHVSISYA